MGRVRAAVVAYAVAATLFVWVLGPIGGVGLQVAATALVLIAAVALTGLLVVRQVMVLKTAVARIERANTKDREQLVALVRDLQEQAAASTSTLTKSTGAVARGVTAANSRIGELGATQAKLESALREVDHRTAGVVKSMGVLGRQMTALESRVGAADDRLQSSDAAAQVRARDLSERLEALTRSATALSITAEGVFASVRRRDREQDSADLNTGGAP